MRFKKTFFSPALETNIFGLWLWNSLIHIFHNFLWVKWPLDSHAHIQGSQTERGLCSHDIPIQMSLLEQCTFYTLWSLVQFLRGFKFKASYEPNCAVSASGSGKKMMKWSRSHMLVCFIRTIIINTSMDLSFWALLPVSGLYCGPCGIHHILRTHSRSRKNNNKKK